MKIGLHFASEVFGKKGMEQVGKGEKGWKEGEGSGKGWVYICELQSCFGYWSLGVRAVGSPRAPVAHIIGRNLNQSWFHGSPPPPCTPHFSDGPGSMQWPPTINKGDMWFLPSEWWICQNNLRDFMVLPFWESCRKPFLTLQPHWPTLA